MPKPTSYGISSSQRPVFHIGYACETRHWQGYMRRLHPAVQQAILVQRASRSCLSRHHGVEMCPTCSTNCRSVPMAFDRCCRPLRHSRWEIQDHGTGMKISSGVSQHLRMSCRMLARNRLMAVPPCLHSGCGAMQGSLALVGIDVCSLELQPLIRDEKRPGLCGAQNVRVKVYGMWKLVLAEGLIFRHCHQLSCAAEQKVLCPYFKACLAKQTSDVVVPRR